MSAMTWVQVLLPVFITLAGILIWYGDFGYRKFELKNVIDSARHSSKVLKFKSEYLALRNKAVETLKSTKDDRLVKKRLTELGLDGHDNYGNFKYRQILLSTVLSIIPFVGLFLMKISFLSALSLSLFVGISNYFLQDYLLTLQVKQRRMQIESEFPALIEMLTLSISSGETPVAAISRICQRSESLLSREFSKVIEEVQLGKPFHEALDRLGRSLQSASIRRFVDALVLAMVRGAPVVEVLHRHVAEARINHRNLVMDKAGRAETLMMIPIVFLILPISVLFALWPSINQLSLFTS